MRADRIKLGAIVDLGNDREPAVVVDIERKAAAELMGLDPDSSGDLVALRLRQEGKQRGCWVAVPTDRGVKTLRR